MRGKMVSPVLNFGSVGNFPTRSHLSSPAFAQHDWGRCLFGAGFAVDLVAPSKNTSDEIHASCDWENGKTGFGLRSGGQFPYKIASLASPAFTRRVKLQPRPLPSLGRFCGRPDCSESATSLI